RDILVEGLYFLPEMLGAPLDCSLANPDAYDNKGYLKNAPNEEVRQRIIEGRAKHLRKEIQTFHENIAKINGSVC
ncbi:hypothetical protein, partial [Streptomyces sp. NPDC046985]|uniref:hypothetical protein n=1 Tax=Streptomyces sp. NPDC046985 TaxID=3155377 RepID=UPI0033FDF0F5